MPVPETQLVLGQATPAATRERAVVDPWQCVVVSSDAARCEAFSKAATNGGWRTIRCRSAELALATTDQTRCQLAILDLEAASAGRDADGLRGLVERLARENDLLLLVCGQKRDPREEIWARQLGVWLYLPAAVPGPELSTLCGEAREIAERLVRCRQLQQLNHLIVPIQ